MSHRLPPFPETPAGDIGMPNSLKDHRAFLSSVLHDLQQQAPDLYDQVIQGNPNAVFSDELPLVEVLWNTMMTSPQRETRSTAARFLRKVGPSRNSPAIDQALEAITNPDQELRITAANWLSLLDLRRHQEAMQVILEALKDPQSKVRLFCIRAIKNFGLDMATQTVAALINALEDIQFEVRQGAVATLAWLGEEATASVPAIIMVMLHDVKQTLREKAGRALVKIDPEGNAVVSHFAACKDASWHAHVLMALGKIGEGARPLRRKLQEKLHQQSNSPPPPRLAYEDESLTVIFDGQKYPVEDPTAFRFFKTIAVAAPKTVIGKELQELPGCQGKRPDEYLKRLPGPLQNLIKSKTGAGYHLCLPV
jgi:hypothetical protein